MLRLCRVVHEDEDGRLENAEMFDPEDENLADLRARVARQRLEDNRESNQRLEMINLLTNRLNELETNASIALNDKFDALTSRLNQLEACSGPDQDSPEGPLVRTGFEGERLDYATSISDGRKRLVR